MLCRSSRIQFFLAGASAEAGGCAAARHSPCKNRQVPHCRRESHCKLSLCSRHNPPYPVLTPPCSTSRVKNSQQQSGGTRLRRFCSFSNCEQIKTKNERTNASLDAGCCLCAGKSAENVSRAQGAVKAGKCLVYMNEYLLQVLTKLIKDDSGQKGGTHTSVSREISSAGVSSDVACNEIQSTILRRVLRECMFHSGA